MRIGNAKLYLLAVAFVAVFALIVGFVLSQRREAKVVSKEQVSQSLAKLSVPFI